jgi:LysM repeat protein
VFNFSVDEDESYTVDGIVVHNCGHMHVPENDHGDPGSMDFAKVIKMARGHAAPAQKWHTVEDGDTLTGIARKHATTLAKIRSLNPRWKTDSNIGLGDKIRYQ